MNKNNSIVMGIGSLLALVLSLPLEWMTLHKARINMPQMGGGFEGFGNRMSSALGAMTISVTGLNGSITLLASLPIWLIVAVGLIGVLLAMLNRLGVIALPEKIPLILMSLSLFFVMAAIFIAIGSSESTVGVGGFVAIIGLAMGYALGLNYRTAPEKMCYDEK